MVYTVSNHDSYICQSGDTKPPGRPGESLHEVDTGKVWIWDGNDWTEDLRIYHAVKSAMED